MIHRDSATLRQGFTIRPDAAAKLSAAPFATDRCEPGLLHAKVLRSPLPHARIVRINTEAAAAMPGVIAVITAADIPGRNLHWGDQPVLCTDRVRYVGDPIAAVAADTPERAAAARDAIVLDLVALPMVDDPLAGISIEAPLLHPGGNLLHSTDYAHGDLAAAFAAAAHVVDDVYLTGRQMHGFMETEGGIAIPDGQGGLLIHAGSHHAAGDRVELAHILALDISRLRVLAGPTGGSFGGKDGLTVQPIAALLALRTGRPVRLHYTRRESATVGVKRHAFRSHMRTACDRDGRLLAHQADLLADAGAYATHSAEVLDTATENASGPYAFDAVRLTGRTVYTNNGIAGAFRGFGATQTQFALERQISRLAALVGQDPAAFRARNLRPAGSAGPLGQVMTQPCHPGHALEAVRRHPLWWDRAQQDGPPIPKPPPIPHRKMGERSETHHRAPTEINASRFAQPSYEADPAMGERFRYGTGLALASKSEGFSKGGPNQGRLALRLASDGLIELAGGGAELGQGAVAAAAALAMRGLGVGAADVRIVLGDSAAPDTGLVAASRLTGVLARGVALAAPAFRQTLLARAAEQTGAAVEHLRLGFGGVWAERGNAPVCDYATLAQAGPITVEVEIPVIETPSDSKGHGDFVSCGAVARVRLDRWTGQVAVEHMVFAPACGPVVVEQQYVGQVEGGAVMGLGLALLEDLPMQQGRYLHLNFDSYIMPSLADAPQIDVLAVEHLDPGDAIGPRGVGEIIINAALAAIANAVADATGRPITRVPIRPDDVL
jgi:CO/xanthine dehydrogenase Mo-binding subunit